MIQIIICIKPLRFEQEKRSTPDPRSLDGAYVYWQKDEETTSNDQHTEIEKLIYQFLELSD